MVFLQKNNDLVSCDDIDDYVRLFEETYGVSPESGFIPDRAGEYVEQTAYLYFMSMSWGHIYGKDGHPVMPELPTLGEFRTGSKRYREY